MAPEEAPGIFPGTSLKEDHPAPIPIGPEIGEGALLLGKIAAGSVIALFMIQSASAPVVAIPMTGKGYRSCDRVLWGKEIRTFSVNSRVKVRKIPLIYWA